MAEGRDPELGVKLILLANSTLVVMAGAPMAPCLPEISEAFRLQENVDLLVPLVLTLPALAIALVAPLAGALIDRVGRKRLLVVGLGSCAVAGSSGLWMQDLLNILAARALLGASVALVMTSTTALIGDYFRGPALRSLIGIQAAFMGYSGVLLVTAGGFLAEFHWRAPFGIYMAALPLVVLSARILKETVGTEWVKTSAREAAIVEARVAWSSVGLIFALAVLGMALFYLIPVQLPYYLKQEFGGTPARAGLAISVSSLTGSLVAMNYRRLRGFLGFRAIAGVLFTCIGLGYALLSQAETTAVAVLALVISGLGLGMLLPNLTVWITELSPGRMRGRMVGGLTSFIFLGQFLSPLAAQPIVASTGYGGWSGVYGVGAMVSLSVGAVFCFISLWQPENAE